MRARTRTGFLVIAVFLLLALITGCGQSSGPAPAPAGGTTAPAAAETIKIGLQAPLSGDNAQYGKLMQQGVQLAINQANAAGGINGKKLELVTGDDKATPAEGVAVVQRMVTKDKVVGVIGGFNSSPTLAAQEVTGKAKVVQIHMGASPKLSSTGNPFLFRIILTDDKFVPAATEYMVKDGGKKKFAALYENTDYGRGMVDTFKKKIAGLGGELVSSEAYNPGDKDANLQLSKLKAANPDAVMIGGLYNEAALFSQQARRMGLGAQLFTPSDGVDSDKLIELGGKDVEGYIFASMIDLQASSDRVTKFAADAKAAGVSIEAYTAIAYDAANTLIMGLKSAGTDPDKLRDAVAHTTYVGVTGKMVFDQNGDRDSFPFIRQVKDGKFVTLKTP